MKIGIDLGNVLIGGDNDASWFGAKYISCPEVEGAFPSIEKLDDMGHELYVVSKAYPRNQIKSLYWMQEHYFSEYFNQLNTFFVLHREDKALVCDALKLDLLIDDRSDIIDHVNITSKTLGYLFTTWPKFWEDYDELRRTV